MHVWINVVIACLPMPVGEAQTVVLGALKGTKFYECAESLILLQSSSNYVAACAAIYHPNPIIRKLTVFTSSNKWVNMTEQVYK